jgi:hypothetical protein
VDPCTGDVENARSIVRGQDKSLSITREALGGGCD